MTGDIREGPKELGGAGFTTFLNTIGATRVQHFLKNWKTPNEDIGKALRIAMAWTQYKLNLKIIFIMVSLLTTEQGTTQPI